METRRLFVLHTVSVLTFLCPAHFIYLFYLFIVIESNDYRYTRSSLTANEIKTVLISVFFLLFFLLFFFLLLFFYKKKILIRIIKQLLPLCEVNMTNCSPSTGNISLGLRPRAILPASGEQIVMLPSHKGNMYNVHRNKSQQLFYYIKIYFS